MFISIVVIWLVPRPIGDLFVYLTSGRDTLNGFLNTPDNWSFTTNNKIWINQNWGTGVIVYLANKFFGEWGLLSIKFIFISISSFHIV